MKVALRLVTLLTLTVLLCGTALGEASDGVWISEENFPDAVFRGLAANYDTNKDGWLSHEELDAVKNFNAFGQGVSDLTGIAYFTELTTLVCGHNLLMELDLSQNTRLESVQAQSNQLTAITLPEGSRLTALLLNSNNLTELDLSACTSLTTLWVKDNPSLSVLEMASDSLKTLYAYGTALNEVDFSACPQLRQVIMRGTLTEKADSDRYDLPDGAGSVYLNRGANFISRNVAVDEENFPDAGFRELVSAQADTNGNGYLSQAELQAAVALDSTGAETTPVADVQGIAYLPNLERLVLTDAALTSLDVSKLSALTELALPGCTSLEELTLGDVPLMKLALPDAADLGGFDLSAQPWLLKASMDGAQVMEGNAVTFAWDDPMDDRPAAELTLHRDTRPLDAAWTWYGLDDVFFFLPNGEDIPGDTERAVVDEDGKQYAVYTAVAIVDGVPFESSMRYSLVTLDAQNETDVTWRELDIGDTLTRPEDPEWVGHTFFGWFTDPEDETDGPYDFDQPVRGGFTLYAHWLIGAPAGR